MQTFLASLYGLLAAASWGSGDFLGGYTTKKFQVHAVILFSHSIGGGLVLLAALIFAEPIPVGSDIFWGMVAGVFGALGVMALYKGLAVGRMGVVAPVSAVITALVPVIFGIFTEGWPGTLIGLGFLVAAVAVWLISAGDKTQGVQRDELIYAGIAGLGFGLLFIFLDQINEGVVYWPLVGLRVASFSLIFVISRFRPTEGATLQDATVKQKLFIALTGVFDATGNLFFILAAQAGRLDVSSVLASMYPAATVFLAWIILREELLRKQWLGVALAMFAVVLIAG